MKFKADDDRLIITLQGWEMFWALKRKLVIPRSKIASLEWKPHFVYGGRRFVRLGGTGAPRLLYAGNFKSSEGWYFLYLRSPRGSTWLGDGQVAAPNVLDIVTEGYAYRRIIVNCREDIGASLENWWR